MHPIAQYTTTFGHPPAVVARAPGRVNLIGEHTDYSEGWVLPFAIEQSVWIAAGPQAPGAVVVRSLALDDTATLETSGATQPQSLSNANGPWSATGPAIPTDHAPGPGWARYIRGVLAGLRARGITVDGANLLIGGDLPIGAGLSSSAALCVATAEAVCALTGRQLPTLETARLAQQAEHDYAAMPCGIMDPYVSLFGRTGHALLLDCRSVTHDDIPLDLPGVELLVIHSGVRHTLAETAYAQRVDECRRASAAITRTEPQVRTLRDLTPAILARHRSALPETLYRRARHVVEENDRVHAAVSALRTGAIGALGDLLTASHRSLRDQFEVSCPEIEALMSILRAARGVLGARMIGGGFGGAVLALVREERASDVREAVITRYRERTRYRATAYAVRPAAGASVEQAMPPA